MALPWFYTDIYRDQLRHALAWMTYGVLAGHSTTQAFTTWLDAREPCSLLSVCVCNHTLHSALQYSYMLLDLLVLSGPCTSAESHDMSQRSMGDKLRFDWPARNMSVMWEHDDILRLNHPVKDDGVCLSYYGHQKRPQLLSLLTCVAWRTKVWILTRTNFSWFLRGQKLQTLKYFGFNGYNF